MTEVIIPQTGSNCDFVFAEGEEYLVYANETTGALSVNICSRTRRLVEAADDRTFIAGLHDPAPKGTVHGSVLQRTDGGLRGVEDELRVVLDGGQRILEAKSHAWGEFEINGVPPGRYQLYVYDGAALVSEQAKQVVVEAGACDRNGIVVPFVKH